MFFLSQCLRLLRIRHSFSTMKTRRAAREPNRSRAVRRSSTWRCAREATCWRCSEVIATAATVVSEAFTSRGALAPTRCRRFRRCRPRCRTTRSIASPWCPARRLPISRSQFHLFLTSSSFPDDTDSGTSHLFPLTFVVLFL